MNQKRSNIQLSDYVGAEEIAALICRARKEDLGADDRDVSGELLAERSREMSGRILAREAGILCGGVLLPMVAERFGGSVRTEILMTDGSVLARGSEAARLVGPAGEVLKVERTALNFLTHLSGVATLTREFVDAAAGTRALICDTRKTLPGLRGLQKYAVACGGGCNHRMGLYDAVIIKDNHLAGFSEEGLADALKELVARAREMVGKKLKFVEVEVDRLTQLEAALRSGADIVLLDNMSVEEMRQAVAMRDRLGARVQLEASGGVTLKNVRAIAETGVERIAIGALTHSAPALDMGLDVD